jgi:hypothetical protein
MLKDTQNVRQMVVKPSVRLHSKTGRNLDTEAHPLLVPQKAAGDLFAQPHRQSQAAQKRRQASAAGALDNKEIKVYPDGHPLNEVKSNREQNRKVSQFLKERAYALEDKVWKASKKIGVCSINGAFRQISETVCHRVGRALCKSRVCPTCQRVLAYKRRAAVMCFYDLNTKALDKFYFYHMTLTLRHSRDAGIRDEIYTSELIGLFKKLRGVTGGKVTVARGWWDKRVAGGIYSVETTPGRDGSPHIHVHVLLLAKMPLWRKDHTSEFLKEVRSRWLLLSSLSVADGGSTKVHLEPVFTWLKDDAGQLLLDAKGERVKNYARKINQCGSNREHMRAAIAECAKYTMKTDSESLSQFSDSFLHDLISTRNRYYGRFGCLHSRDKSSAQFIQLDRLNADFKDIEEIDKQELLSLYDPETGEVVAKHQTKLLITPFSNTRGHTAAVCSVHWSRATPRGGEHYYSIRDRTKACEFGPDMESELPKLLSLTLYRAYNSEDDL